MPTLFPLVRTPKEQQVGPKFKVSSKEAQRIASIRPVPKPLYPTEMDVTRAIADKSFKGFASAAYAEAIKYQAYLKAIQPRQFFGFKKSAATKPLGLCFRPGYTY